MEWLVSGNPVAYPDAIAAMETRVAAIRAGTAPEQVWLLEHPPLYTAGTSASPADLLRHDLPVFQTGRGGQFTYHGPGQRIGYVMLDLKRRRQDIRWYICQLEQWLIDALMEFGVAGERRQGRVGIWVRTGPTEKKIAAIGVRVRQWVTFHGVSLNINPDLQAFQGIVPCGIRDHGVTSLADLGILAETGAVDDALQRHFPVELADQHGILPVSRQQAADRDILSCMQ